MGGSRGNWLTQVHLEGWQLNQGSHTSWKVMEFKKGIFQAWKVMENDSWKMTVVIESHG